ncbi:MAG: heparan-alpha-glucosaminide N-acetyltransferase [Oscillospiraceae bacterium]
MKQRIALLDLWRTMALLCMIGYHLCYDLVYFGMQPSKFLHQVPVRLLYYTSAYPFLFLAGASCRFSHDNLRRGFRVFCCGLLVSAAGIVVQNPIQFGVLHFLGCGMILYGLFGTYLERIPRAVAPVLWIVLFVVTKCWLDHVTVQAKWLWMFGFPYEGFYSSDYYPLLPWIFLFLLGTWFGGVLQRHRENRILTVQCPSWLTWPGRHTLWIYLLHQPVLYGVCMVLVAH